MVQMNQTSWQEYSLTDVMDILSFPPMNLAISTDPILHYILPKRIAPGAIIKYNLAVGFKVISWTGIISAINGSQVMVRLEKGPFRGFMAKHEFEEEGNITSCIDSFTFQGFTEFSEESFSALINKAHIVYALESRKEFREIRLAVEARKKTQSFESLESSATAG